MRLSGRPINTEAKVRRRGDPQIASLSVIQKTPKISHFRIVGVPFVCQLSPIAST